MKSIWRFNVFETNSSAVHSMVILPENEFKRWEEENLFVNYYDPPSRQRLFTLEEAKREAKYEEPNEDDEEIDEELAEAVAESKEQEMIETLRECGFATYESWNADDGWDGAYEEDVNHYTTKHGDRIVIRCKYGENR